MYGSDKEALKQDIVSEYTSGRTASLREMTLPEYSAALRGMAKAVATSDPEVRNLRALKKSRSFVLHQMQLMGIDTADWGRVDAYCLDSRIAGKKFAKLDEGELDALLVKLRVIRRKKEVKEDLEA
jgi:hypothetical protein